MQTSVLLPLTQICLKIQTRAYLLRGSAFLSGALLFIKALGGPGPSPGGRPTQAPHGTLVYIQTQIKSHESEHAPECCLRLFFFFCQSTFPWFISENFSTHRSPHFPPRCVEPWRPAWWWCDVCPSPKLGGSPAWLKDRVFQWYVLFFFLSLKK